jgi:hypothetical protein
MATNAENVSIVLREQTAQSAPPWPSWLWRLKHLLGLDRAIAYTVLARVVQILGSTGTVFLIVRFLTPVEQGYYYTLLSLVALQAVFELGFSFVILQMAAHESAHLEFHADGRIDGDLVAHARLASILRKAMHWYPVAAIVLCGVLLPLGMYFFSHHARTAAAVSWQGPWTSAVVATAFLFLLNPFFSFLEGCGQVWQVGRMRFVQCLLGASLSWTALLAHHGLYSPAMANFGYAAVGLAFLYRRRRFGLGLLRYLAAEGAVSWRKEIWPFQWRIAVSWAAAYFTGQILVPMLFAYRGPTEAGQFGMSLAVITYLSVLMISWMSTKATPFGQMIARGEITQLRQLFFRTLRQALGFFLVLATACAFGVIALYYFSPRLAGRMVSPGVFGLLLLASGCVFVVQSMAIYLRSFKREPFVVQSVSTAVSTVLLAFPTARAWGSAGAALVFLLCTGIFGLIQAISIFRRWNRSSQLELRGRRSEHEHCEHTHIHPQQGKAKVGNASHFGDQGS